MLTFSQTRKNQQAMFIIACTHLCWIFWMVLTLRTPIVVWDVDPVARMESFRALTRYDPNGVFSHPKTLTIGEFYNLKEGFRALKFSVWGVLGS